jgi:hypothetical protein
MHVVCDRIALPTRGVAGSHILASLGVRHRPGSWAMSRSPMPFNVLHGEPFVDQDDESTISGHAISLVIILWVT